MNYVIKEIEKDDIYDYVYVNTNSWNETYRGIVPDEFLDRIMNEIDQNAERQKNKFDQTKIDEPDYKKFLLLVDDEPVGMLSVSKSREEVYPDSGELCSLYLLNKSHGRGLGRVMFEYAKNKLKELGYTDMVISCIRENPTNEFYKHMGGRLVSTKPKNIGGKDLIENIYYYEKI